MAAVIAAPNNGTGMTGAAWKASLFSSHMTNSPLTLTGYDAWQGIRQAANAGARVISMAWGGGFWQDATADEIVYWHVVFDRAFVGAAGTTGTTLSQSWVVFPARMAEVLAVSSAWPNGQRDPESHYGPQLDVVAYGNSPTSNRDGSGLSELARSSGATAIVTGVVALVRARFPLMSAADVYERVKAYAGPACGIETSFGPIVNALAAVGSFCDARGIMGPGSVWFESSADAPQVVPYNGPSLTANAASYQWSDGITTQNRSISVAPGAPGSVETRYGPWVTVTDLLSGVSRSFSLPFTVHTGPFGPGNCGGHDC
jgi:hypothetical protein